jgi:aminoglycoside 3-N-acetyltransferase
MAADRIVSELRDDWRAAGILDGETVLVHSSLKRTVARFARLGTKLTPEAVLESFIEAVGREGTLLFPLFNFDFCKGEPFDIRRTPSQMGALTEAARQHPQAVRTGHPVYSFAVIGKHSPLFREVCNVSAYGPESPFQTLRALGGKIGVLNLPGQHSMTIYHHVEELHEVPYRFAKWFEGDYTGWDGSTSRRRFSIFVRDLERGVLTHVEPTDDLLWEKGLYLGCRYDEGHGFRAILANDVFREASRIIESGQARGMLYQLSGKDGQVIEKEG